MNLNRVHLNSELTRNEIDIWYMMSNKRMAGHNLQTQWKIFSFPQRAITTPSLLVYHGPLQTLPNPLNPHQIASSSSTNLNLLVGYFSCSMPMHQSWSVSYVCDTCRVWIRIPRLEILRSDGNGVPTLRHGDYSTRGYWRKEWCQPIPCMGH